MDDKNGVNDSSRSAVQTFRLGSWQVEPELNRLVTGGQTVQVEPRLMKLLVLLAERPGKVTSKDDIVESVWGTVSVSDESLAKAVSKLRKILGDDSENPRYIETIRKTGYRLIAEVAFGPDASQRRFGFAAPVAISVVVALAITGYLLRPGANTPVYTQSALNAVPITSIAGRERDPGMSNDGNYVVYSSQTDDDQQIFLHGIGRGTQDRQLTTRNYNGAAVFFPDDSSIAFLRKQDDRCTVTLITLIDGAERILGDCSGNDYADTAIAPEGRRLAFNARDNDRDSHAIYVLDIDTGSRRAVTSPPDGIWGDYDPQFSADGSSIVFARSISEGMQDIYAIEIDNGVERRITDEGRNVMGIALRGNHIFYGSNRGGRYGIWSIELNGENRYQLPITSSRVLNPSLSADGSRLVFEELDRAVSLTTVKLGASDEQQTLLAFNADLLHPDVSPASRRIVFSTDRSGFYEIWDADEHGGDLKRLTDFSAGFTAHPKFSPAGDRIAFDARPRGISQIHVMNQDGSGLIAITDESRNAYAPTWSRDGRSLYYAAESGNTLQIFRTGLAAGNPVQITSEGGIFARVGADDLIYHVRPGEDGIWRIAAGQSARVELVTGLPGIADWGNWELRNGRVLFFDRAANAIRAYIPDSGKTRDLAHIQGTLPMADPSLAFSASGDRAYLGLTSRLDSDLEFVEMTQ